MSYLVNIRRENVCAKFCSRFGDDSKRAQNFQTQTELKIKSTEDISDISVEKIYCRKDKGQSRTVGLL